MIRCLGRDKLPDISVHLASGLMTIQAARYGFHRNTAGMPEVPGGDAEQLTFIQNNCDFWSCPDVQDDWTGNTQLASRADSWENYLSAFRINFPSLLRDLDIRTLVFVLEIQRPWIEHESFFPPVEAAMDRIASLMPDSHFNGIIRVDFENLRIFLPELLWMIRGLSGLPTCYFSGLREPFVGQFAPYGGVQLDFYNRAFENSFVRLASSYDFEELAINELPGHTQGDSFIEGRQLTTE